jgi:uncharacterized damage-inducible protein DinB
MGCNSIDNIGNSMKPLCNANLEVLQQLKELVLRCEDIYLKDPASPHAGIGQHVRHVLDHYRAFKAGTESGTVDYNLRQRQCAEETSHVEAKQSIDVMMNWLADLNLDNQALDVISEISLVRSQSERLSSNTERELLYLINHSIHHMAYASLLAKTAGVELPRHIGLAPGTATYERSIGKKEAHCA